MSGDFEKFLSGLDGMTFLEGWTLVGMEGKPNFELRFHLDDFTGDVYYTFVKDLRFMNVRTRSGEVVEHYPTASMEEISLFEGAQLQYCNVSDFDPYVSKDDSDGVTHLYGVASDRHVFKGPIEAADMKIMRWALDGGLRVYGYVTPASSSEDKNWRRTHAKMGPNYSIHYYDSPELVPCDYLVGYNARNPLYGEYSGLIGL